MRALLYDGQLRLANDHPQPRLIPGEAVIRVRLAGICNTDVEITRGYMGFQGVLGHEFVGMVEEAGDSRWVGQRVVGEINCYCGTCPTCRAGDVSHCPQRTTLGIGGRDGAMADYCLLPEVNLHVVPEQVPDEEAVFAEPLAAALEILEQVHIKPTQRVAVLGDGKLGLLVAQVMRLTGCDLVVVGRHADKLAILEHQGIATTMESGASELRSDVVIDCTGQPDGFATGRAMVRPRGTYVLKSTFHGVNQVNLTSLVVDEVSLVGSRCGPFEPALRLLALRLIDVTSLVAGIYPLDQAVTAFAHARTRGALKVLIRP
ncbi:MAG TPA: alcohol dehydrogenase catalytic domain-containing protein [Anaerolineae bacterium]|nr:alcohol dehydrogenase catalytic domain-containing protein [Anaerolineae bacterium]HQJ51084.1 alcohol dehydrogenase catalytic domain-containing protein [Anaerolineae bacterium]